MTRLKAIKQLLKQNNQWREYRKKYAHRQMRLIFSKIALIYNPELSVQQLYQKEVEMLKAQKNDGEKMFKEVFKDFGDLSRRPKVNWGEFAIYMWYVFQTSTYWKDKSRRRPNTFNTRNYIEINQIKRQHYDKWIKSIDLSIPGANDRIIKVQKAVF